MKVPPVIVVQLVHITGPMKGEIQEFADGVITIGRNPSNQVVFPADHTSISRKHAEIIREGNSFRLVDHSANGTFINGKRTQEQYLKDGDVLMFADGGPKVSFLTQMKEGAAPPVEPVAPPPPPPPPPRPQEPIRPPQEPPYQPPPPPPRPQAYREPPPAPVQPPPPPVREQRTPPPVYAQPEYPRPAAPQPASAVVQKASVPLTIQYGPMIKSYKTVPVIIGKHPKCDFVLDHPAVLDQHVQIYFSANQYWVKDLTGKALIKINHRPIDFSAQLSANDDIALSPRGPVLRYLGEGRFAENSEAEMEQPEAPPKQKAQEDNAPKGDEPKGFFAKLKKNLTKD